MGFLVAFLAFIQGLPLISPHESNGVHPAESLAAPRASVVAFSALNHSIQMEISNDYETLAFSGAAFRVTCEQSDGTDLFHRVVLLAGKDATMPTLKRYEESSTSVHQLRYRLEPGQKVAIEFIVGGATACGPVHTISAW